MSRKRVLLLAGVVGIILAFVALMGTPGSLFAVKNADGGLTHRDLAAGVMALIVMGMLALGLDLQDL